MDGHRFDELVKALAGSRSRRGVLRVLLGGGAAAFALGAIGRATADEEAEDLEQQEDLD